MTKIELTDGSPVPPDCGHTEIDRATGMQKGYIVLSPEERAKGFVKPVRRSYTHDKCGTLTTMGLALCKTYARYPHFYTGTFCCGCGTHFPLDQFHWEDGEPMDPDLQDAWCAERDARVRREREEYRQRRIAELNAEITRLQAEGDA